MQGYWIFNPYYEAFVGMMWNIDVFLINREADQHVVLKMQWNGIIFGKFNFAIYIDIHVWKLQDKMPRLS